MRKHFSKVFCDWCEGQLSEAEHYCSSTAMQGLQGLQTWPPCPEPKDICDDCRKDKERAVKARKEPR